MNRQLGVFDEPDDGATSVAAQSDADLWLHAASGLLLPRGTVVKSELSADELAELEARSDLRDVQSWYNRSRNIKRTRQDETQLHALCEWFSTRNLNILGTVTFSDDYAASHNIYSLSRALTDVWNGLTEMTLNKGKIRGFRGRFLLSGEWHPSGRHVPHVHLVLDSRGAPIESVCSDLWRYFYHTRGRSKFEPIRDVDTATLYALKDTIKASAHDPECLRMRLTRPKRQPKPPLSKANKRRNADEGHFRTTGEKMTFSKR